jgi:hypothetical protein
MSDLVATSPTVPRRKRRLQFSLRALLIAVTLAATLSLWLKFSEPYWLQRAAAQIILSAKEEGRPVSTLPTWVRSFGPPLITFDDLKLQVPADGGFDQSLLTRRIRAIEGSEVRLRGYMFPLARATGIKEFILHQSRDVYG